MIKKNIFLLLVLSTFIPLPSSLSAQQKKKKRPTLPPNAKLIKDIEYTNINGLPLLMDLYLPKNAKAKTPVVMWVHGGGWKNGRKEKAKGIWLVKKGFAVASINYRLIQQAKWPAQINDCRAAVRFLRANAQKYNLDGNNIAAWGSSAGGHLVAVLGTQPLPKGEKVSSRVQAILDWYGPSDLLTMPPNVVSSTRTLEQVSKSNGALLLGSTVRDVPDLAKEASGFWNVSKGDPPFLIMHGDADPAVPVEQSIKLHKKQIELKAPSELYIIIDAKHGGKEFLTEEVNAKVLEFFTKTLKASK